METFIKKFCDTGIKDIDQVGYKNAGVGKMTAALKTKGILIPDGFIVSVNAYQYFIAENHLYPQIKALIESIDKPTCANLPAVAAQAQKLIMNSRMPAPLAIAIIDAYDYGFDFTNQAVAVRSSIIIPNLTEAAVTGVNDTFLNRQGHSAILYSIKQCYASLFTERAIQYAIEKGYLAYDAQMAVGIQEMVRCDTGSSGVGYTHYSRQGHEDSILIKAIWGLGDMINQGDVIPDEYLIARTPVKPGFTALAHKVLGSKQQMMVCAEADDEVNQTLITNTPQELQDTYVLNEAELKKLSEWAATLEEIYGSPMCFEWARDGRNRQFYLLQVNPYSSAPLTSTTINKIAVPDDEIV